MGSHCIICGEEFIGQRAVYCINCYNKHEKEIENYRALCDYCKDIADLLDQDPDNEELAKKLKECNCGVEE